MSFKSRFKYNEGELLWDNPLSNRTPKGTVAGTYDQHGYKYIRSQGKKYQVHRIIWEIHNGDIPEGVVIDHIDRNPRNNKIENLRLATRQQNSWNARAKGYCFVGSRNKYVARLNSKHLGYFDSEYEAKEAYESAAKLERGEFHNG